MRISGLWRPFVDETAVRRRASSKAVRAAAIWLLTAGCLGAQWYPRHNITFGVGGASPRAGLRAYFQSRPALTVSYGYRFIRYFQIEAGLDTVFGAAGVRDYYESPIGALRIRDYQFLAPVGARAILPLAGERLQVFGGGGFAYLRYSELLRQPSSYLRIDCPVCGSRSGHGYYSLAGLAVFVDRGRHFRTGITTKMYRGHTEGDPLGAAPGLRTRDQWFQMYGEFGLSF